MDKFIKYQQWLWAVMGVMGVILMSCFSIRHNHFVSDLGGLLGCLLLIGAYLGFNWKKIKQGDHRTRVALIIIVIMAGLLIILEIVQQLLG